MAGAVFVCKVVFIPSCCAGDGDGDDNAHDSVIRGFLFCLAVGLGRSLSDPAPASDSGGGGTGAVGDALPFPAGFGGYEFEEGAQSEDHCSSSSNKICSCFYLFVRGTLADISIFHFGLIPLV